MNKKKISARNKNQLKELIKEEIKLNGNNCNLGHIDVSNIDDMSYLFSGTEFNGDISKWDVSNWNVSKVKNMSWMFLKSEFNNDISEWDVENIKSMRGMFRDSNFTGDISRWNVNNVEDMVECFECAKIDPWWNIENYEKRQSEIQKRILDGFFILSSKTKKLKI